MPSFRRLVPGADARDVRRGISSSSSSPSPDARPLLEDEVDFIGDDDRKEQGGDAAAQLLRKIGAPPGTRIKITAEDDARVLRRIDYVVLPLMLAVYFLQGAILLARGISQPLASF